jgi:hypothetical protein
MGRVCLRLDTAGTWEVAIDQFLPMAARSQKLNTVTVSSWGPVRPRLVGRIEPHSTKAVFESTTTHFVTPPQLSACRSKASFSRLLHSFLSRFVLSGRGRAARKTDERELPGVLEYLHATRPAAQETDNGTTRCSRRSQLRPTAQLGSCVAFVFSRGYTQRWSTPSLSFY